MVFGFQSDLFLIENFDVAGFAEPTQKGEVMEEGVEKVVRICFCFREEISLDQLNPVGVRIHRIT